MKKSTKEHQALFRKRMKDLGYTRKDIYLSQGAKEALNFLMEILTYESPDKLICHILVEAANHLGLRRIRKTGLDK